MCVCACVPQCVCVSTFCEKECVKPGEAGRAVRLQLYLCIVYLVFFHFPLRGWRGCCNFQNTAKNISTNCCACLPTYIKRHKIGEGTLQHKTPFFFFFCIFCYNIKAAVMTRSLVVHPFIYNFKNGFAAH